MIKVEIDEGSGFCFGVVTAINKAEEELAKGETLYCLGDIVHNSREVERLKTMGLITINREEFKQLRNAKVLRMTVFAINHNLFFIVGGVLQKLLFDTFLQA